MNRLVSLSILSIAAPIAAQSNTVAGLDGRLTVIDNLTRWGHRGAAYPNGEVGMSMRNTMCNPGSVNIPWQAAMQPNHPKFGFIIARVNNDRIEQISDWSYCKHAFTSVNTNGSCGSCQNPGTGSLMGINCSDTYGSNHNADRRWLGPPSEIDPWLGTWNPVGSYFDQGDPNVGPPQNMDGIRSPHYTGSDSVHNRVTVKDADLNIANADYYYGIQLIHQGEAVANRDDNLAHRGFNPNWSGSQWSFSNNSNSQQWGSILDRWPGATVEVGQNGNDDGRFFVATKVTPIGGNDYHYEYAVHNVDNSRAGATIRIPLASGVTASNFSFRDIDNNLLNDWSATQAGNEVVFSAPAGNPLEWNTIYNFGFDADRAPGAGVCRIDEARVGPGALYVDVAAEVPGGVILANFSNYGAGCEGSVTIPGGQCPQINANGGTLSNQTNQYEYCYEAQTNGPIDITSFEIYTASNSGTITRPAHVYADVGGQPSSTPLATTTITVNAAAGFYTATLAAPVTVNGTFYIGYENSPGGVISELTSGQSGVGYYRTAVTGSWTQSGLVDFPSYRVNCTSPPVHVVPSLGNSGLPVLNTTYNVTLSDAVSSAPAIVFTGLSDSIFNGTPLPATVPGAPGCEIHAAPLVTSFAMTSASGTASSPFAVANSPAFIGLVMYHQWAVLDNINALGLVVSNAGRALVGN